MIAVDVLPTPEALKARRQAGLRGAVCVVFDVLRATSTLATALEHGAREVILVPEIQDALRLRAQDPELLLAGERGGQRITAASTGSVDFDLGNSPAEFSPAVVAGRTIAMTTTNGTRALDQCRGADTVLAASFLNLRATVRALAGLPCRNLFLVCAGTGAAAAYEDVLGAGALLSQLPADRYSRATDVCVMARILFENACHDLEGAFRQSTNGRRLAADPELAGDLAACARVDTIHRPIQVIDNHARFMESEHLQIMDACWGP